MLSIVSKITNTGKVLSVVSAQGVVYFQTLGDCDGIRRIKEWALRNKRTINPAHLAAAW